MYQECLADYDADPDSWNGQAGWRHPAYLVSLFLPPCFLLIEMCLNQLTIHMKHIICQYAFTLFYIFVTAILQLAGTQEIYVAGFDWNCLKGDDSLNKCQWKDLGSFFGKFLALQTGFYILGLLIHVVK